jgi:hypothetical protein
MDRSEREREEARRRTVAALLAGTAAAAWSEAEEARARERRAARLAWAGDRMDAWKRAMKKADDAWMALIEPYADRDEDEEMPDLDPPPEQAVVDAILAEIHSVTEKDRWPRHLHWSPL